jgi:hypothetical protein
VFVEHGYPRVEGFGNVVTSILVSLSRDPRQGFIVKKLQKAVNGTDFEIEYVVCCDRHCSNQEIKGVWTRHVLKREASRSSETLESYHTSTRSSQPRGPRLGCSP